MTTEKIIREVPKVLLHDHLDGGLRPATIYHFQVSSEDNLGLTGKSSDKTFKTKSVKPEILSVRSDFVGWGSVLLSSEHPHIMNVKTIINTATFIFTPWNC